MRRFFAVGLAVVWLVFSAQGETFPLEFKLLEAKEALEFPGNYGSYGQLRLEKPSQLKGEPKPVSKKPLYSSGNAGLNEASFLFRLDESKRGSGYDRLIIDINRNGSLEDDPVLEEVKLQGGDKTKSQAIAMPVFGPVRVSEKDMIGQWRPQYFAQATINLDSLKQARPRESTYLGILRVRAGWYLTATAKVEGAERKVALIDGNANLKLGDYPQQLTHKSSGKVFWYFQPGDNFLNDVNGSGAFERDGFGTEWCSFSPVVYFGAKPCKLSLSSDCKSIGLESWTEPLATVSVEPHGDQVASIGFGWESSNDQWRLMRPNVENGKMTVPAGNYRLFNTALCCTNAGGAQIMALGSQTEVTKPVKFSAGQSQSFACGAPLVVKINASKDTLRTWEKSADNYPGMSKKSDADSKYVLRINAEVVGMGGEVYSSYGVGKDYAKSPPKPVFTIHTEEKQQVAKGNLEYG